MSLHTFCSAYTLFQPQATSAIEAGITYMHCKMYEGSSNPSHHCILAIWDSYRSHCRQSWPIIAHIGCFDKAYSARGAFSGPLLLLFLRAQSIPGVASEI